MSKKIIKKRLSIKDYLKFNQGQIVIRPNEYNIKFPEVKDKRVMILQPEVIGNNAIFTILNVGSDNLITYNFGIINNLLVMEGKRFLLTFAPKSTEKLWFEEFDVIVEITK